jgi:hypothetical protein
VAWRQPRNQDHERSRRCCGCHRPVDTTETRSVLFRAGLPEAIQAGGPRESLPSPRGSLTADAVPAPTQSRPVRARARERRSCRDAAERMRRTRARPVYGDRMGFARRESAKSAESGGVARTPISAVPAGRYPSTSGTSDIADASIGSRRAGPPVSRSGVGRIRTDDIRLAKAALYQLSYDPNAGFPSERWWARADLNCRPHAYQACALTN